jgi:hypothetical protein
MPYKAFPITQGIARTQIEICFTDQNAFGACDKSILIGDRGGSQFKNLALCWDFDTRPRFWPQENCRLRSVVAGSSVAQCTLERPRRKPASNAT